MSLSIGIVGLPNVGKSTLFNALTGNKALAANYPFATIEPNTGIVNLPDPTLEKLSDVFNPDKTTAATVTFVDIAGLVAGAHKGEGLGNQFLANIRECAAIAHVVRAFQDDNVTHVLSRIDPLEDIDIINTELVLADLSTVDRRLPIAEKEARADTKKKPIADSLAAAKALLDAGKPLHHQDKSWHEQHAENLRDLHLLTMKPVIFVFNIDEGGLVDQQEQTRLRQLVAPAAAVFVNATLEAELKDLPAADQDELLASYGVSESGLAQLARVGYDTLKLQSYYTAGEKEVRAWTIPRSATAPQAAGVIHTDFERGFIAADVVNADQLISDGSWATSRAHGHVRTEGKAYHMQPNDVVEFKFNVSK